MVPGPTRGAIETTNRSWVASRYISRLVGVGLFLAPLVAAWLAVRYLGGVLYRPAGIGGLIVWLIQAAVLASGVAAVVDRCARRLLPLKAVLGMTLTFPDHAPSRFGVALRSGTLFTEASFGFAELSNASFDDAAMSGVNFNDAVLSSVRFIRANMAGTEFFRTDARDSNFTGAGVQGGRFGDATLTGANFSSSALTNADVNNAILSGADLSNASFEGAFGQPLLAGGATYSSTTCPDGSVTSTPSCWP